MVRYRLLVGLTALSWYYDRREASPKNRQIREQAGHSAIAVEEGMDRDKIQVNIRVSGGRRVHSEKFAIPDIERSEPLAHQLGDMQGFRKFTPMLTTIGSYRRREIGFVF